MIRARSADGVIHEFPDGTPDAVIDRAMKSYAGGGKRSAADVFTGTVRGARDKLVQGVKGDIERGKGATLGSTARMVGDAANLVLSPLAGVTNALIVEPAADALSRVSLDAYDAPRLEVGREGVSLTPARRLEGEDRRQAHANDVGLALSAARPNTRPAPAPRPARINHLAEPVAKMEAARVTPSLAATKGNGFSTVANAVAENPIAGVRARGAMKRNVAEVRDSAERIAGKYGQATDRAVTGEAVQQGVRGFNQRFSERAGKIYDQAFADIEAAEGAAVTAARQRHAQTKVEMLDDFENAKARGNLQYRNRQAQEGYDVEQSYRDARQAELPKVNGRPDDVRPRDPAYIAPPEPIPSPQIPAPDSVITAPSSRGALRGMTNRVNGSKLSDIITDGRLGRIADALTSDGHNVRFADLRALRTWVREARSNDQLRQGISQGNLKQLEQALTQDIYANAEALAGPQGARRLKQADQFYRLGAERIEGALQNFVGKGGQPKAGESTYDLIIRAASDKGGADVSRLYALKKSLKPEEWGDVSATAIERLGRPTAGMAEQGDFSVGRFVTGFADLSPRGKDLLFGQGAIRRELDNLAEVAGMVKRVERGANASKSAVAGQAVGTVLGGIASLPATAKFLGAMALTGEAMTNPALVRWLSRLGTAQRQSPQAVRVVVRQLESAAKANAALTPLYQEALKLSAPPLQIGARSLAEEPETEQTP